MSPTLLDPMQVNRPDVATFDHGFLGTLKTKFRHRYQNLHRQVLELICISKRDNNC